MRKYRPVVATLIALLFYTLTDILVWQRIFEAHNMVEFAGTYHAGWFVSLAGYASMGVLLMWGRWKDCLYFVISLVSALGVLLASMVLFDLPVRGPWPVLLLALSLFLIGALGMGLLISTIADTQQVAFQVA